jgi:hypothetical protein
LQFIEKTAGFNQKIIEESIFGKDGLIEFIDEKILVSVA